MGLEWAQTVVTRSAEMAYRLTASATMVMCFQAMDAVQLARYSSNLSAQSYMVKVIAGVLS